MHKKWNGEKLGVALIEALGLPKRTSKIELALEVNQLLKVRCEYWPDDIEEHHAGKLIAEFSLFKRDEIKAEPTSISIDEQIEQARKRLHMRIDMQCEFAALSIHRHTTEVLHSIYWRFDNA